MTETLRVDNINESAPIDISNTSDTSSSLDSLICDFHAASRFLTLLDEDADCFTFQDV